MATSAHNALLKTMETDNDYTDTSHEEATGEEEDTADDDYTDTSYELETGEEEADDDHPTGIVILDFSPQPGLVKSSRELVKSNQEQDDPDSESETFVLEPGTQHNKVAKKRGSLSTINGDDGDDWSHISSLEQEDTKQSLVRSLNTASARSSTSSDGGDLSATSQTGSLISGFDLISLSGDVKRRCKQCTFHNNDGDGICAVCSLALVANPCLEMDEQIAKHLQLKEENRSPIISWAVPYNALP